MDLQIRVVFIEYYVGFWPKILLFRTQPACFTKSKYSLLLAVAFRLFTSSIFWFVNCGLQFDFGQTFTMQYMGLINENLQSELCQKFDILWIIDNANIFFRDFGPVDSKILNKLFEIQVNYDLRFADLLSFWLWIKLYQLWCKSQDETTNRVSPRFEF